MKVGCRARACTGVNTREVEQLLDAFFFQDEVMRQQNIGLRLRIAHIPTEVGGFNGDATSLEVLD